MTGFSHQVFKLLLALSYQSLDIVEFYKNLQRAQQHYKGLGTMSKLSIDILDMGILNLQGSSIGPIMSRYTEN